MSIRRMIPHPALSSVLLVCWLLLNNSVAAGHVVLGSLFALAIPMFTRRFFPEPVYIGRVHVLVRLVLTVLWDILLASMTVAMRTLGPMDRLRPRFIRVPVALQDDFALTALTSTISLTPGTVSAQISADRQAIIVHALNVDDEQALVDTLKARYEAPIKEIFKC